MEAIQDIYLVPSLHADRPIQDRRNTYISTSDISTSDISTSDSSIGAWESWSRTRDLPVGQIRKWVLLGGRLSLLLRLTDRLPRPIVALHSSHIRRR
jgi:hypothetical protein